VRLRGHDNEIDQPSDRVSAIPGRVGHDAAPAAVAWHSGYDGAGEAAAGRRPSPEAEFTAFMSANYNRLLRTADLITGDLSRAEDLLQTVLTRTFLRWSKVRQASPLGYVRAGLVNARTDWWRRLSSRERPAAALPETRTAPDHAGQVVGRDAVQRALAVLTRRERTVVVLRFYEDMSEAEIALVLGIAPGTVKSTCARALAKLRVSPELTEPAPAGWSAPGSPEERS
jgi:RNA polymerase sigma-70 factor (sigma-E family)